MELTLNGTRYALDMEKVVEFFVQTPAAAKQNSTSISHTYSPIEAEPDDDGNYPDTDDFVISEKSVTDVKFGVNDNVTQLKFNLIMTLIEKALPEDTDMPAEYDDMPFGRKVAINTLIECGILYNIEDKETEDEQE